MGDEILPIVSHRHHHPLTLRYKEAAADSQ